MSNRLQDAITICVMTAAIVGIPLLAITAFCHLTGLLSHPI